VVIEANQQVGNYWFRAEVQDGCGVNKMNGNIKSIFRYKGARAKIPASAASSYTQSCDDEKQLVPYVKGDVPSDEFISQAGRLEVSLDWHVETNGENIVHWRINDSPINTDWSYPTLQYVQDGNTSYPREMNLIEIPEANSVSPTKALGPA
jgi:hypothetical protein